MWMPRLRQFALAASFAAVGSLLLAGCETAKYDKSAMSGESAIASQASKYWKKEGWWSLKQKTGKIMITEFSVEYLTDTDLYMDKMSGGPLMVLDYVGVGDSKREYDQAWMQQFPAKLYIEFTQALEQQGFSVIPMQQVTSNPAFAELAKSAAGDKGSWNNRGDGTPFSPSHNERYTVYPTPGLPTVDDSWFKGGGNYKTEARVAGEVGADIALRVRIRVGVDDKGRALLGKGSSIHVLGSFKSAKWGDGLTWWADVTGLVVAHNGFYKDGVIADDKGFKGGSGKVYKVDCDKLAAALLEMFPSYAEMGVHVMKQ